MRLAQGSRAESVLFGPDRAAEPATGSPPLRAAELALTGERTLPGVPSENYWFRRHEAAYLYLVNELRDGEGTAGRLLEVGAGEGYGASLLAEAGRRVLALDYDALAIGHLAGRYRQLSAVRGNLAVLPVASESMDSVVSLQVIEHVWDHPQFLAECVRVLRPGGLLVLSTPNRLTFSPGANGHDKPVNPFHTHEFTADELSGLVGRSGLRVLAVRGLQAGPRLTALDARYREFGGFAGAQLSSSPEQWPASLAADVSSIQAEDFPVSDRAAELDTSLDLLLLARRVETGRA